MAYFSNGSEGVAFDYQCGLCKYGDKPCPIALVQYLYNYEAVNNETATKILNDLVKNDGTCEMYETFKDDLSNDFGLNEIINDWPVIETIADKLKQEYIKENWEQVKLLIP